MLRIARSKVEQVIAYGHELERAEGELRGLLDGLDEEEAVDLIALLWIGRESFAPEDLAEARTVAAQEATTPLAQYLLGTPHFPDHLEAGLDALNDEEDDEDG